MKIYCQKCGFGVSYSSDKPKFCSSCGHAHFPSLKTQESLSSKITQEDDEEEASQGRVLNITSLQIEFDNSSSKSTKLKNLIGTSNESDRDPEERNQIVPLSQKDFLESFKKEAGFYPSRQSPDETESD